MPNEITKITRIELIEHLMDEKRLDLDEELASHRDFLESQTSKELVNVAEDYTDKIFEIEEA